MPSRRGDRGGSPIDRRRIPRDPLQLPLCKGGESCSDFPPLGGGTEGGPRSTGEGYPGTPSNSPLAKHGSLQSHNDSLFYCKEGQVIFQHGVELLDAVASQGAQGALQHPQSGQKSTRRDRATPFALPAAQPHQQLLERDRRRVLATLQGPDRRDRPQRQQQPDQDLPAVALQPLFQLPAGTFQQLVKALD